MQKGKYTMNILWKITYIQNGEEKELSSFNKKTMIKEYLDIMNSNDISNLKMWKNDKDYTVTLNKFLSK